MMLLASMLPLLVLVALTLTALGIEKVLFRTPMRWWRFGLIWLSLFAVLHLDVAVGYFVEYRPMVKRYGDGRVLKRVVADGFLDAYGEFARTTAQRTEPGFVLFTQGYPFRYVELETVHARHSRLLASPSQSANPYFSDYVHFYKAKTGSTECAMFDALPDVKSLRNRYGIPDDACIASKRTHDPISTYEMKEAKSGRLNRGSLFPIEGSVYALVDRRTNESIADCSVFDYHPLIGRVLFAELISWSHNPSCRGPGFWRLIVDAIEPMPNKNTTEM